MVTGGGGALGLMKDTEDPLGLFGLFRYVGSALVKGNNWLFIGIDCGKLEGE